MTTKPHVIVKPGPAVTLVRKRPGMYIGETDGNGCLNMLLEVLANSYDQYLAGRCSRVTIEVLADGTIVVADDGPGISAAGDGVVPPLQHILSRRFDLPTVDGHRPHAHLSGAGGLGLLSSTR